MNEWVYTRMYGCTVIANRIISNPYAKYEESRMEVRTVRHNKLAKIKYTYK